MNLPPMPPPICDGWRTLCPHSLRQIRRHQVHQGIQLHLIPCCTRELQDRQIDRSSSASELVFEDVDGIGGNYIPGHMYYRSHQSSNN